MPEETTSADVVDAPADANTQTDDNQPSLSDVMARLEKIEQENERLKGSVSRKDKDLIALKKEKETLEKEKLSVEELKEKEINENNKLLVSEIKTLKLETLGIDSDSEFSSLLDGQTGHEVKAKAEMLGNFKASILKEANEKIAELNQEIEKLKGNMKNPGSGNSEAGGLAAMTFQQLNDLSLKSPARKAEVLAELTRRTNK